MIGAFRTLLLGLVLSRLLWVSAAAAPTGERKALIIGRGIPYGLPNGGNSHPEVAAWNFLTLVGNPRNDPTQGWTLEFTWNLMEQLNLDPTNTPVETLFRYIGEHKLGYRIAIGCGPHGCTLESWKVAAQNGIMPFAPQGDNLQGARFDDPMGLRSGIGCAGGFRFNETSTGPGVEFFDHTHSAAQSWANQAVAAKYAWLLDAHPNYNVWDARQHLRQAGSSWATGWGETNGYGIVDTNRAKATFKLLPGPPVDFLVTKSRDRHQVFFSWQNFLQSDFAATVLTRGDGRLIYEGTGTNFTWTSDLDGDETFVYWSKNRAGEKSRIETYQRRRVTGLCLKPTSGCLVLGAPAGRDGINLALSGSFQTVQTNWRCDLMYRPGNAYYDRMTSFPNGAVVGRLPGFSPMVDFAISNGYRMVLAPITSEEDLFKWKADWDRAAAAGLLVVVPHHYSPSASRKPNARRLSPPRLYSAITVGSGTTNNLLSFGPGLEFYDAPVGWDSAKGFPAQLNAAAVIAGKLSRILDANPQYNPWDARQHLRQSATGYSAGWSDDGGYGRPPEQPARIKQLELAPPLDLQATPSNDGASVAFSWQNFLQSRFSETVITRGDGTVIYHGAGTNFLYRADKPGGDTFQFFSQDASGQRSRSESYTTLRVEGSNNK